MAAVKTIIRKVYPNRDAFKKAIRSFLNRYPGSDELVIANGVRAGLKETCEAIDELVAEKKIVPLKEREPEYIQTWREDALCHLDCVEQCVKKIRKELPLKRDYQAQIAGHTALEYLGKALSCLAGAVERKKS